MLSPVGSAGTLSIITSASYPSAAQTSTHSAQPLQWIGSTKMPKAAGSSPLRAGTSAYFWVRTKWARAVSAASAGSGWAAANASILRSVSDSGRAIPRIAVSGQALTQVMQPTHFSRRKSGMRGARWLKSRVAAVPGGMTLRATPMSAGSSASATPRR